MSQVDVLAEARFEELMNSPEQRNKFRDAVEELREFSRRLSGGPKVRPVTLPREHRERVLADLKVGEEAWTLPWGMTVTRSEECYLNSQYPAQASPGVTVDMLVRRVSDGFLVRLSHRHEYNPTDNIPWVGATAEDLVPVIGWL